MAESITGVLQLLKTAYASSDAGRPLESTDVLIAEINDLMAGGDVRAVEMILENLEPERVSSGAITGVLSYTWHFKDSLGSARSVFFDRAMGELERRGRTTSEIDWVKNRLK